MKEVFQGRVVDLKTSIFHVETMNAGVNCRQLPIGLYALIIGVLFYCFFRSTEYAYFLKLIGYGFCFNSFLPSPLDTICNSLPTFIPVFALSLITGSFIAQGHSNNIIPVTPGWFPDIVFLENTQNSFLQERFDYFDFLQIGLDSLAAYAVLIKKTADEAIS